MEKTQYIVGARDTANRQKTLQSFLDLVEGRGDTTVRSGDVGKHLIVDMEESAVDHVRHMLGEDLIIEKDSDLSY